MLLHINHTISIGRSNLENMGNLFNPENTLFQIFTKVAGVIQLSLLWFLFSIPIITIGASTTALYYTVNKTLFKNRGYIAQEFWGAFKSNFKQSTIAWIVILFLYILAVLDFYILRSFAALANYPNMDYVVLFILLALVTCWANYLFPCIARFANTTGRLLINALIMALLNLPWTLLLMVSLAIAIALFYVYPPLLFVVPALYMCCEVLVLERIFRKYMSPEDLASEDAQNHLETD